MCGEAVLHHSFALYFHNSSQQLEKKVITVRGVRPNGEESRPTVCSHQQHKQLLTLPNENVSQMQLH